MRDCLQVFGFFTLKERDELSFQLLISLSPKPINAKQKKGKSDFHCAVLEDKGCPNISFFDERRKCRASKKKKFDSFQYIAFRPKVKASAFFLCDEGVRIEGKGWEWKIAIGNKSMFALYNEAFPAPISLILKSM